MSQFQAGALKASVQLSIMVLLEQVLRRPSHQPGS